MIMIRCVIDNIYIYNNKRSRLIIIKKFQKLVDELTK